MVGGGASSAWVVAAPGQTLFQLVQADREQHDQQRHGNNEPSGHATTKPAKAAAEHISNPVPANECNYPRLLLNRRKDQTKHLPDTAVAPTTRTGQVIDRLP